MAATRFFLLMQVVLALLLVVGLAGCMAGGVPPVSDRSRVNNTTAHAADYRVVAGDTLYSIAWRHQRDFRELAALNKIRSPYDIFPGQRLRVRGKVKLPAAPRTPPRAAVKTTGKASEPPARPSAKPSAPHPMASTRPKPQAGSAAPAAKSKSSGPARKAPASAAPARVDRAAPSNGPVALTWPGKGKRLVGFGQARAGSPLPSNSIDFLLPPGASIRAAAAGEVVYVGRALAGFEQFVIVKHNDTWLSAYGFNAPAKVREKERLASGSVLAVMGRGGAQQRELHFEVRKNGAPVNPAGVIK